MQFNADKTKEMLFSTKQVKPLHLPLKLGNEEITRESEHKHLGMILDTKPDFNSHIREAITKARRRKGIIKYLANYFSRDVLDQVYKLYVRPHLDYGGIIYHKNDPNRTLEFTNKLERIQYTAVPAVTGAW